MKNGPEKMSQMLSEKIVVKYHDFLVQIFTGMYVHASHFVYCNKIFRIIVRKYSEHSNLWKIPLDSGLEQKVTFTFALYNVLLLQYFLLRSMFIFFC